VLPDRCAAKLLKVLYRTLLKYTFLLVTFPSPALVRREKTTELRSFPDSRPKKVENPWFGRTLPVAAVVCPQMKAREIMSCDVIRQSSGFQVLTKKWSTRATVPACMTVSLLGHSPDVWQEAHGAVVSYQRNTPKWLCAKMLGRVSTAVRWGVVVLNFFK